MTSIPRIDASTEKCPGCGVDWEFGCTTGVDTETGKIIISCCSCTYVGWGHMDDINGRP